MPDAVLIMTVKRERVRGGELGKKNGKIIRKCRVKWQVNIIFSRFSVRKTNVLLLQEKKALRT